MSEGGRVKVSDQLNHTRTNLMKIAFLQDSVQISEPELHLLSFFRDSAPLHHRLYSKVYLVVPTTDPVVSPHQGEELRCGDVLRAGDLELVVRESVDGRDRTKYSGVATSHSDHQDR